MPYINCVIQPGLSREQKEDLVDQISKITNEELGAPYPYIHVSLLEVPMGQFVESGVRDRNYETDDPT